MTVLQRIESVLQAEAAAIASIPVTRAYEDAVASLAGCTGKVVTIGMGKAGIIARKFAATLCSTRTPAVYLHPGDALHGDLGVIGQGDVVVAFSTSGKTLEVLEALAGARSLTSGAVIGVTSHGLEAFRRYCTVVIDLGQVEEPCPLGLTPSASCAAMLAVSDALALALLEVNDVTAADFGRRHRAGYLGDLARQGISGRAERS